MFIALFAWLWSISFSLKEIISSVKEKRANLYKVFIFFFILAVILISLIKGGLFVKKASESSIYFEKYDENEGYTYPTVSQNPELLPIRDFIIDSKFPVLHNRFSLFGGFPRGKVIVSLDEVIPENNVIVFRVHYGIRQIFYDINMCSESEAWGIKHNDKVGIINSDSCGLMNFIFDPKKLKKYDFDSNDTALFNIEFLRELGNPFIETELLYLLAKDKDTPEETLLDIANELSLSNNGSYYGNGYFLEDFSIYETDDLLFDEPNLYEIALALLENPKIKNNKEILLQINKIPKLNLEINPYITTHELNSYKDYIEYENKRYLEIKSGAQDLLNKLK